MTLKERLIRLSGDDYRIVKHCDSGSQLGFFLIGLFIPVIFVVCFASGFIAFRQLFNSAFATALLSLFFAWVITNLYRLMLYTFSVNPLPQVNKKPGKIFSRLLRLVFLGFIVTMIAKPIESVLYKDLLDVDVAAYKTLTKHNGHNSIALYYQKQIDEIIQLSENDQYRRKFMQDRLFGRQQAIFETDALIDSSGFFLQRLRFLCTNHRSCWWITSFFLLVFLYPLALKYYLRNCSYYQLRAVYEQRKVELNYYAFQKKYARYFEKLYTRKVVFSEQYEDAPYNTVRNEDKRRFLTENEFIAELYHV